MDIILPIVLSLIVFFAIIGALIVWVDKSAERHEQAGR